jgi:hypothetical protein
VNWRAATEQLDPPLHVSVGVSRFPTCMYRLVDASRPRANTLTVVPAWPRRGMTPLTRSALPFFMRASAAAAAAAGPQNSAKEGHSMVPENPDGALAVPPACGHVIETFVPPPFGIFTRIKSVSAVQVCS